MFFSLINQQLLVSNYLYDELQFILTVSTSFACFFFITFCRCFKELAKRSEKKKTNALDGAVLVGTVALFEIKLTNEECTYNLSDCIFFLGASFSGNKSNKF